MQRLKIGEILKSEAQNQSIMVFGWVRTFRSNRFIAVNDGSCLANLQAVVDFEKFDEAILKRITVGAAIQLEGNLTPSLGSGQNVELTVTKINILGDIFMPLVVIFWTLFIVPKISEEYRVQSLTKFRYFVLIAL